MITEAEQQILDAFERGKAFGYAEGIKTKNERLAHLEKMIVWYSDITMTGINSEEYENGFWDAVDFVKWHQVKDKN